MVCHRRVGCNNHKYSDNTAQHVDEGEPCIVGEQIVDIGDDGANKGDYPGQLLKLVHALYQIEQPTVAIEIVAKANGSPMMFSILILLMPPRFADAISILPFILRSDGECSDPYDGIRRIGSTTVSRESRVRIVCR